MMTFFDPLRVRPQPEIVTPDAPRIVLFDPTLIIPEQENELVTRTTEAFVPLTAEASADELPTLTDELLPPPVVPPFWVAQPTRPLGGFWLSVVVVVVVVVEE